MRALYGNYMQNDYRDLANQLTILTKLFPIPSLFFFFLSLHSFLPSFLSLVIYVIIFSSTHRSKIVTLQILVLGSLPWVMRGANVFQEKCKQM